MMAENKKETECSDILKRAALGGEEISENKILKTKQVFYQPSGELAEMTISEATTKFMIENYPTFVEKSLSFPEQSVDYGLPTQALLLEEDEL